MVRTVVDDEKACSVTRRPVLRRMLVVDDDPRSLDAVVKHWVGAGYVVERTGNAEDEDLLAGDWDVVIADQVMGSRSSVFAVLVIEDSRRGDP